MIGQVQGNVTVWFFSYDSDPEQRAGLVLAEGCGNRSAVPWRGISPMSCGCAPSPRASKLVGF